MSEQQPKDQNKQNSDHKIWYSCFSHTGSAVTSPKEAAAKAAGEAPGGRVIAAIATGIEVAVVVGVVAAVALDG